MEENVALDSNKQKDFVKSVKGIKRLINKRNNKEQQDSKQASKSVKDGKIKKRRRPRGLVYLGHIPHGFYEHEMTQYFRQFGLVTNARVIRSKRTGNSKGYAFVEFKDPEVAQIVSETMNNYLMGKRLIKASYIPPEAQRRFAKRKHWSFNHNPSVDNRQKHKKAHNAIKTDDKELQMAKTMLATLNKTKKKLKELGINYDFFKPVDIPEGVVLRQDDESDTKQSNNKKVKVKKEGSEDKIANNKVKVEKESKPQKNILEIKPDNKPKKEKAGKKEIKEAKNIALKQTNKKTDDETQKQKRQSLKESNVKLLEDFINIQESDGDSDGSLEFDSDEFEQAMEEDDSVGSSDESDASLDGEVTSNDDEEDEKEHKITEVKQKPVVKKLATKEAKQKPVVKKLATIEAKQKPVVKTLATREAKQKPIVKKLATIEDKQKPVVKKLATIEVKQKPATISNKNKTKQKNLSPKVKFEKQSNKKTLNKVIKKKK